MLSEKFWEGKKDPCFFEFTPCIIFRAIDELVAFLDELSASIITRIVLASLNKLFDNLLDVFKCAKEKHKYSALNNPNIQDLLNFVKNNKKTLRAEFLSTLYHALSQEHNKNIIVKIYLGALYVLGSYKEQSLFPQQNISLEKESDTSHQKHMSCIIDFVIYFTGACGMFVAQKEDEEIIFSEIRIAPTGMYFCLHTLKFTLGKEKKVCTEEILRSAGFVSIYHIFYPPPNVFWKFLWKGEKKIGFREVPIIEYEPKIFPIFAMVISQT